MVYRKCILKLFYCFVSKYGRNTLYILVHEDGGNGRSLIIASQLDAVELSSRFDVLHGIGLNASRAEAREGKRAAGLILIPPLAHCPLRFSRVVVLFVQTMAIEV